MRLRKVHLMEIMTTLIGMSTVVAKDIIEVQFDPPPKLECSIVPVNGRVIRLDIVNTNDTTPVNILKWNSILEDFPVARVPFYLRTAQDGRDIDRSPSAHATYVNVLDTHFIQISPLNPYQLEIDLSRWFAIPTRENYTVRWNGNLKGFLGNHGSQPATEKGLKRSDLYTMPGLDCFAEAEVELDSSVMPSQVGETAECSLWQYRGDRVRDARNGAIDLAKKTKTNALRKKIFWRRYFNGNAAVEADVSRVFSNIEEYPNPRGGNSFLLTERCAINDRAPCGPGVVSYHIREEKTKIRSTIVFCPLGLGNALARPQEIDGIVEAKQECDFPGPGRIPQSNRDMMDLTGVYLNAFLRSGIPRAGAEDIEDGLFNTCYGHFCANEAAFLRNDKRFGGTSRPTRPIPNCEGFPNCNLFGEPLERSKHGSPENIAANYELYAYSMRALSCPQNKIRYCSKEACEVLGNIVVTFLSNNLHTLLVGVITPTVVACIPILFHDEHGH